MNTAECRTCKKQIVKVWGGEFFNGPGNRRVYVNEDGMKWGGKRCPPCLNRHKIISKFGISVNDEDITPFDSNPLTHRKCRKCTKPLRASSYLLCVECKPYVPLDYYDIFEDYSYHG